MCEFGESGNIATIENAFAEACNSLGYGYEPKFSFPVVEDFRKFLEDNEFFRMTLQRLIANFQRFTIINAWQHFGNRKLASHYN